MFKQRSRTPLWLSGPLHCSRVLTVTVERTWVQVRLPTCTLRPGRCDRGSASLLLDGLRLLGRSEPPRAQLQPSSWPIPPEKAVENHSSVVAGNGF